jgi:hypothetical protein
LLSNFQILLHLLASIECGRIGVEAAEVIAPFLVYPLLREAVLVVEPGEIEFDWQGKLADLTAKNAKLREENAFLRDQNAKLTQQIANRTTPKSPAAPEKKILPAELPPRPEKLIEDIDSAAARGDIASVRFLLAKDSALARRTNYNKMTPLHWAAYNGHAAVCSLLLESGADIEAKSKGIYHLYHITTPLLFAASQKRSEVVSLLLKKGAQIDPKNDEGRTPLHIAAQTGALDAVRILVANGANRKQKDNFLHFFPKSDIISWKNAPRPRKSKQEGRGRFLPSHINKARLISKRPLARVRCFSPLSGSCFCFEIRPWFFPRRSSSLFRGRQIAAIFAKSLAAETVVQRRYENLRTRSLAVAL